jgi:hypothetical protein
MKPGPAPRAAGEISPDDNPATGKSIPAGHGVAMPRDGCIFTRRGPLRASQTQDFPLNTHAEAWRRSCYLRERGRGAIASRAGNQNKSRTRGRRST